MKPGFFLPTLFAGLVLFAAPGHCETPHLIKPIPADQAVDVSVTQGRIVLMFDQNMKMDSWSLMESGVHPFPPMLLMDEPWLDPLTFELKVKALQPGTTDLRHPAQRKQEKGLCCRAGSIASARHHNNVHYGRGRCVAGG